MAENDLQARLLDSMEVTLSFDEPQPVLDDIVGSIFNHLTKEGVNEAHLSSLISDALKAIDAHAEAVQQEDGAIRGQGADALQA